MYIPDGVSPGNHAGQLYTFSGTTATKSPTTYTVNSGLREPDAVMSNVFLSGIVYDGVLANLQTAGIDTTALGLTEGASAAGYFKNQLQNEFNEMIASVNQYKRILYRKI